MNGLEPYYRNPPPPIPLSGGARFVRGFGRIGFVLAVLVGIGGSIMTYYMAHEAAEREVNGVWQRQCIRTKFLQLGAKLPRRSYNEQDVDLWEAGCSGPDWSIPFNTVATLQREVPPEYYSILVPKLALGAFITICSAAIPLVLFLTLGWIAAGFTRF
jgi:hypothetical protein